MLLDCVARYVSMYVGIYLHKHVSAVLGYHSLRKPECTPRHNYAQLESNVMFEYNGVNKA